VLGSLTTAGANLAGFFIRFASNFIVARHLLPDDFGVYGFALVYAAFAGLPWALSLPQAIVQLGPGHARLFGTVRRLQLYLALALAPVTALVALVLDATHGPPVAASFLGLAAGQAIASFSATYDAVLQRAMRYHFLAVVRVASIAASIGLTLAVLFASPGPFVLVLRDVLPPLLALGAVALYLRRHRADPALEQERGFDRATAASVWKLSRALAVNRVFEVVVNRLDALAVGLVLGERGLGHYTQAKYLAGLPSAVIAPFSNSVALRTFAAVRDDRPRLARALHLVQWAVARAGFAFALGCVVAPDLITHVAFGPGWDLAAEMLRFFAGWIVMVPLAANFQMFFTATQDWTPVRLSFVVNAVVLPLALLPALLTDSPVIAPLANSIAYVAMVGVLLHVAAARGVSVHRHLLAPVFASVAAAALALFARATFIPASSAGLWGSALGGAAIAFATFAFLLFAFEGRAIGVELRYLRDVIRRRGD
jgi:O-antigen/teichoic acid export membrane protein